MIGEFCTWCRELVVNGNLNCRECESCTACGDFDGGCCTNKAVISECVKELGGPSCVLGIGPPLCRKYCPHLPESWRRRAAALAGGEGAAAGGDPHASPPCNKNEGGKNHKILFTPLPKFWLNCGCECITFEIDFSETMYYHMVLLGRCEWEVPDHLTVEVRRQDAG